MIKGGGGHFVTKESLARLSKLSECRNSIHPDQLQTCHASQQRGTVRECELILNRLGLQLKLSSDQLEQQWICEKNCSEMADEIDGTTCAHFFSVDQKLRIQSEHKRKLPKVMITVNTEVDSSNGKTAPQQCLSVKSQINTGGHVALASTHCIPAGKTVEDQKYGYS